MPRLEAAGRGAGGPRGTGGLPAPAHSGGTPRLSCRCSKACSTPCPGSYEGTVRVLWELGPKAGKCAACSEGPRVDGQKASRQDGLASGPSENLSPLTENDGKTGHPVFPSRAYACVHEGFSDPKMMVTF